MEKCKGCVADVLGICQGDFCRAEREALIEEAERRARQLGHALSDFVKSKGCPVWRARCIHCDEPVAINLDPAPGEAAIYGEAVETGCAATAGRPHGTNTGKAD